MTSLALAARTCSSTQEKNSSRIMDGNGVVPNNKEECTTITDIRFPSPRHRVVSSESEERASLVYFGYPPSHLSLEQVRNSLREWSPSSRGHCLPHDYYYLLKNQSDGCPATTTTTSYEAMKSVPLGTVVETKWKQVQR